MRVKLRLYVIAEIIFKASKFRKLCLTRRDLSEGKCPGRQFFLAGIPGGNCLGGNCPGGNLPRTEIGLYYSTYFFKPQESESTILLGFFFCWTRMLKPFFPITSWFAEVLWQKSEKDHKYRYISIAITLCLMKFFNNFLAHVVDCTVEFDIIRSSEILRSSS